MSKQQPLSALDEFKSRLKAGVIVTLDSSLLGAGLKRTVKRKNTKECDFTFKDDEGNLCDSLLHWPPPENITKEGDNVFVIKCANANVVLRYTIPPKTKE